MSLSVPPAPIAFARHDTEGEAIWHLDFLATVKASGEHTGGRLAVVEMYGPKGAGSPLHIHRSEDEWLHVLEGELTISVGGQTLAAPPARSPAHRATSRTRSSSRPRTRASSWARSPPGSTTSCARAVAVLLAKPPRRK
jgi:cupin domain